MQRSGKQPLPTISSDDDSKEEAYAAGEAAVAFSYPNINRCDNPDIDFFILCDKYQAFHNASYGKDFIILKHIGNDHPFSNPMMKQISKGYKFHVSIDDSKNDD